MPNEIQPHSHAVASETLANSVQANAHCPECGQVFGKSIFADGDEESCQECGTVCWFELRFGHVHAHRAQVKTQGLSLGEALAQRAAKIESKARASGDAQ